MAYYDHFGDGGGGGGRKLASVPLVFTLSQCFFNGTFNKLANTYWVPTGG